MKQKTKSKYLIIDEGEIGWLECKSCGGIMGDCEGCTMCLGCGASPKQDTEDWEERFDETDFGFVMNAKPKRLLKQFIKAELDRVREENFEEMEEIKEMEASDEAHRTKEGYCCACGYDMAVMQEKIDKARKSIIIKMTTKKMSDI